MVIAVPAASAAKRSKTDKAQNKALKAYGKATKKNRRTGPVEVGDTLNSGGLRVTVLATDGTVPRPRQTTSPA